MSKSKRPREALDVDKEEETPDAHVTAVDAETEVPDDKSEENETPSDVEAEEDETTTFESLGIHEELCKVLKMRGWTTPTPIQREAIPPALEGRDVIGLAVTGSGKTGAFVLPILQSMLSGSPHPFYALAVAPTRELCIQIAEQFKILGAAFQLKIATLTGGLNSVEQAKDLARQPHVLAATPGRLVDHLQNTKGFNLNKLKFLVLDEADRLLSQDFEEALHEIIKACNPDRQTFLFSATMTSKVSKLQRVSLQRPVKVEVNVKTQTALKLTQYMVLVPVEEKFAFVMALLKKFNAYRSMVFCNTCKIANVLNAFLKRLNFSSVALSGDMPQHLRLAALNKFKKGEKNVLITTEVAARGMDLPSVNYVINFDVPTNHKDYIHRVGRTARAGNVGSAFTLVTKLDVQQYKMIENKVFGDDKEKWPKLYREITKADYAFMNFQEAKNAAEKEYEEAQKKNVFKKRRKKV